MSSVTTNNKNSKLWRTAVEVIKPDTVEIQGKIPDWLNGSYLRVGPGKFDFDKDFCMNHWFDGYSIISKFDIQGKNGTVSYTSKYLESDTYQRALKAQKPVVNEFGTKGYTEEGKSIFSRIASVLVPELSDNSNVSFFTLRNEQKLFVTGETCFFQELSHSTLTIPERFDTNKVFGLTGCCAHPLTDETGATYNFGTSIRTTGLRYHVTKIPPHSSDTETSKEQLKKSKIIFSINSRWSTLISYNHSFGLTKNYIIFIEQPYLMNIARVLAASVNNKKESIRDWLEWHPEYPNRFYIINKNSGQILNRGLEIVSNEPFFFLHFINSYESEDGRQIIVDISMYDTPDVLGPAQEMTRLRGDDVGTLGRNEDDLVHQARSKRFIIPLDGQEINTNRKGKPLILTPELIMDKGLELPTINKRFQGRNYNFYYASGLTTQGYFKNSVCKVHVNDKRSIMWRDSEHYILGEPIFVPNKNLTSEEDDGVLIVPMSDSRKEEPDALLFFDPKNMTELGRAVFNENVPCALHGVFVPSSDEKCLEKG